MSGTKKVPYGSTTSAGVFLGTGQAPANGAVFTLGIKDGYGAHVTVPPSVTVASGSLSSTFDITWASIGSTVLQAQLTTYGGEACTGTVFELGVEALSSSPRIQMVAPDEASMLVEGTANFAVVFSAEALQEETISLSIADTSVLKFIDQEDLYETYSITLHEGSLVQEFITYSLKLGTTTITATHSTGTKTATVNVVPRSYGPASLISGPTGVAATKLGPQIV